MSMYRKGCFSNYFLSFLAFVHPGIGCDPDDGAGWAAFDRLSVGQVIEFVIYHCEIVLYFDQTLGGIFHTTLTGIAGDLTFDLGGITKMQVFAGNPQLMADGVYLK